MVPSPLPPRPGIRRTQPCRPRPVRNWSRPSVAWPRHRRRSSRLDAARSPWPRPSLCWSTALPSRWCEGDGGADAVDPAGLLNISKALPDASSTPVRGC
jgi:hypothetical protein